MSPLAEVTERLQDYRRDGYTLFERVFDETIVAALRDEMDRLEAAHEGQFAQPRSWWFGNVLERSPALMWPVVANEVLVGFAEAVFGPFVQLDNLTLAAFPPVGDSVEPSAVSGWHRDRWSHMPNGRYERPLAVNAICYLQDLDEHNGPLRVVPDSHIQPEAIEAGEGQRAIRDERLLYPRAGDVVFTHNGLLHSGTPNRSSAKRYFMSIYYNHSWLKHTDTFDGPNCRQLIAWARRRGDHRALRLLGQDAHLQARGNSGFVRPDEERWRDWQDADAEALKETSETRKQ